MDAGRVIVAGGSGLVGRALVRVLVDLGHPVTVLSRNPEGLNLPTGAEVQSWEDLPARLEGASAVVNLAGESIAGGRWTASRKAALRDSRIQTTRRLVEALRDCRRLPAALVNASAIGYYGNRGEDALDESDSPGSGFLADTCRAWETEAAKAAELGLRVVRIRTGVVLAREGGALPKMAAPIRVFLGCRLGSGRQGLSWIHRDDLVAMFVQAVREPTWEGAYNGTAPAPLGQAAFTRLLARHLHRPLLPVPGPLTTATLKILLGEMAEALLLQGAFVVPARAQSQGFEFRFSSAEAALEDLL